MDGFTNQPEDRLQTPRRSKWPLKFAAALLGAAMIIWSLVLPVLGIVYLVQLLS